MPTAFRIATFNVENLGEFQNSGPTLAERIIILRPQLRRLRADILCLQEVDGQRLQLGKKRYLKVLKALLEDTPYAGYHAFHTTSASRGGGAYDKHNLVILSRFPFEEHGQIRHDLVPAPLHRQVTAIPASEGPKPINWERALIWSRVILPGNRRLTVVNLHLRAPRAAWIEGQKKDPRSWLSMAGWAEGFFLASVKQVGQALEARLFVERLFDADQEALIAVCGDLNADTHEMPLRILQGDEEDMGSGCLASRLLVPLERSLPQSQRFTVVHGGRRQMLDHILVSQPMLAWYRGGEIHNETLGDELSAPVMVQGAPVSYHAPMAASFEILDAP